jgi:4-hydroxyphenylpyruvate dioxygenase-like putative hemolysin
MTVSSFKSQNDRGFPRMPDASFTAIDHVQLAMPPGGGDEARYFYGDILGMVELRKPEELAKRGGSGSEVAAFRSIWVLKMISGPRARRIPRYSVATTLR